MPLALSPLLSGFFRDHVVGPMAGRVDFTRHTAQLLLTLIMYYVYVLLSLKDGHFYVGYSADLKTRFKKHLCGRVATTKRRLPLQLVYYEAYLNRLDAKGREVFLKSGSGLRYLKKQLNHFIKEGET